MEFYYYYCYYSIAVVSERTFLLDRMVDPGERDEKHTMSAVNGKYLTEIQQKITFITVNFLHMFSWLLLSVDSNHIDGSSLPTTCVIFCTGERGDVVCPRAIINKTLFVIVNNKIYNILLHYLVFYKYRAL